jgi:hypothetical protein
MLTVLVNCDFLSKNITERERDRDCFDFDAMIDRFGESCRVSECVTIGIDTERNSSLMQVYWDVASLVYPLE